MLLLPRSLPTHGGLKCVANSFFGLVHRDEGMKARNLYVIFRIERTNVNNIGERFNLYEWMIIYFNYVPRKPVKRLLAKEQRRERFRRKMLNDCKKSRV